MSKFFHYDHALGIVAEGHAPAEKHTGDWNPIECYASGVAPSQAQDLRDFFAKHGENVEVTKNGDPVYTSASQRRRLLKLRGLVDKSSFC
jgi:hypothetical protein